MLHFREQFLKTGLLMTCRCVPDSGAIKAITPPVTPLRRRKKKKEKGKKDKREAPRPPGIFEELEKFIRDLWLEAAAIITIESGLEERSLPKQMPLLSLPRTR